MSFGKFKIRGIVYQVGPRQEGAGGYVWREVVLTDGDARFPSFAPVSFSRDRADLPDGIAPGQAVDVEFYLRGHLASTGRAFATLGGLSIAPAQLGPAEGAASAPVAGSSTPPPDATAAPPGSPGTPAEDLPF